MSGPRVALSHLDLDPDLDHVISPRIAMSLHIDMDPDMDPVLAISVGPVPQAACQGQPARWGGGRQGGGGRDDPHVMPPAVGREEGGRVCMCVWGGQQQG